MDLMQMEIILIASVVAGSCALIGSFLVLRKMAMLSDAISHAILFGIVITFFYTRSLASFPMLIAATATGVLTVFLVEVLVKSRLVKEDAAIGIAFPALFSIGVILISRYAGDVHLDTDVVLLGELVFAPFDRLVIAGRDLGPRTLWLATSTAIANLVFIALFFKELKLIVFDPALAAALGFSPAIIHYALMTLVSATAVSSFEAVGSVLVVALMIAPPAAAYLLTDRLALMLVLGPLIGILSSIVGYFLAYLLDASIAGSMATVSGIIFTIVLCGAPRRGLVQQWLRLREQRIRFAGDALLIHLSHHAGRPEEAEESSIDHIDRHLRWNEAFGRRVIAHLTHHSLIRLNERKDRLYLTDRGKKTAADRLSLNNTKL
ncbi:MAG TPA: metal ABC transporter permease [Atribacteraceae bacterium]|nr:metal ABC transporter permease [Atribacteraceae bacterium]